MAKEKSERNRTIIVKDNEIPGLKKLVTAASDIICSRYIGYIFPFFKF